MYSLNRMGFNKPLCNTRQYGSGTMTFDHAQTQIQNNMVLLKPEYLGNDRLKFINNFGLQSHLISDKQFADVNSIKPPAREFYPSSYTSQTDKPKAPQTVIPLPEGKISKMCHQQLEVQPQPETMQVTHKQKSSKTPKGKTEVPMRVDTKPNNTMRGITASKFCKSSRLLKKNKQKRKQTKQGVSMPCNKSRKIKNVNKPWHKTSLKLEIMEITDIPSEKSMESPVARVCVQCEAEPLTLPMNIVGRAESCDTQNFSPATSPSSINVQKPDNCHQFRAPSECESEDSFIVFDGASNSFDTDILELDEFCYSSSTDDIDSEDDNDEVCSIVSSLEDIWPATRVRFANDKDLCEVHPMIQWSFAYQKARKGPWEQFALDRTRFQRRISDLESTLNYVLQPEHRNKIYLERFVEGNM